ncbi:hypothetical protein ARTSIC4J27_554 [Pseudarthrobacter siccitolerans]|uniref:Uncharacterized protein n=1 Tax=Pseudarthrobacter siccitolerans TaxID=861266 RepID=A0A024GYC0_9MICC|nr:hypothetical protein [Pseudarthrobacter siccitolerans]CCQ44627.1 hypothetical protein ARTSIC4J27_554 [Pseudarthrobacter siccitolerans]
MAARKNHFTARLVVEEVVFSDASAPYDRRPQPPAPPTREVQHVAEIVFRADSLDALAAKLAAHTALLGDS